jgi:hypothetical protein
LLATCDQAFLRFDEPFSGAADLRAHNFAACMLPAAPAWTVSYSYHTVADTY